MSGASRAVLVLLALVLAACGRGGDAIGGSGTAAEDVPTGPPVPVIVPTTAAPPPSLAPSQEVAPTPPPAVTGGDNRAGALEFAEYVLELVAYVQIVGDPTLLDEVSLAACSGCTALVEQTRALSAAGGWVRGGELRALSTSSARIDSRTWSVSFTVRAAQQRVKESAGSPVRTIRGGRHEAVVDVARDQGRWVVGR
ncbi:MAG: DUF6318 family protein, partial [Nocardioidaceae bacterium]